MPSVKTSEVCTLCPAQKPVMHSHHTIPQSCGGKDSKQIILCPDCHNILHAHALHMFSCIVAGKTATKSFWPNAAHEQRALPYVHLIVKAFVDKRNGEVEGTTVLSVVATADLRRKLDLIKKDKGLRSLEQALAYCIEYAYSEGTNNHARQQKSWWRKGNN